MWKTVNHRINQSTGGIETESTNALTNLFRYDPAGRLIKTTGTSLTKTRYDGLGRVLRRWTLAADGTGIEVGGEMGAYASDYGDYDPGTETGDVAIGTIVAGDVVLELQQSVYEAATGNLLGRLNISRSQAEPLGWASSALGTMGDLHTDIAVKPASIAAGNVKGRLQLTTYFYDELSRVTRTGFWGAVVRHACAWGSLGFGDHGAFGFLGGGDQVARRVCGVVVVMLLACLMRACLLWTLYFL